MAISKHLLKIYYSITSLIVGESLSFLILVMFSRISHRMDAVKQVNSGEEAAIELASVSLKRKAENAELSNSIESRDETPERGLEQVGRNDPSDVVSEGPTKKKGRFELTETSSEFFFFYQGFLHRY